MQLVKVRLRKPRRVFSFLSYDLVLKRDDACIVQSDRGLEYGICILPPEPIYDDAPPRTNMRVVRRVNDDDQRTHLQLIEEEKKAYGVCLDKIKQRRMPMKLVDAEYTFDKRKIVFYFTAEDRVDFRELVRDLAHDLKTRIELRHIQVRDEAKMVGGIGSCGRELCCSTWLNEFKPISMRMAKRQNLSLNPSKISGQCGRLLCCLSYENELYESFKKKKLKAAAEAAEAAPTEEEEDALAAELDDAPDERNEAEEVVVSAEPEPDGGAPEEAAGGPPRFGDDTRGAGGRGGSRRRNKRKRGFGGGGSNPNFGRP
ncbi:MAG TPA: regulatory iron-sulfur-containing complex subunit RicT [Candidatus Hydrogenedentes bacterium]|nr:regulatory iron-sulfur-containing complex subunit RicT [Candidatus Hydrogenedentota bacterium]